MLPVCDRAGSYGGRYRANIGAFAILAAKRSRGQVVAVEPMADKHRQLNRNLELNRLNQGECRARGGRGQPTATWRCIAHRKQRGIIRSSVPRQMLTQMQTLERACAGDHVNGTLHATASDHLPSAET